MTNQPATRGGRPVTPRLHGDLLTTSLLALLRGWNAYGYQLAQQLKARGLPVFDQGTVYRTLRKLEESGLVSSFWDTSTSGPARRMYALTTSGETYLSSWLVTLDQYQAFLRSLWEVSGPAAPPPSLLLDELRAEAEGGDPPE